MAQQRGERRESDEAGDLGSGTPQSAASAGPSGSTTVASADVELIAEAVQFTPGEVPGAPPAGAAATLLSAGLTNRDLDRIGEASAQLAGLGFGRTPAGDDYLVGALHAAHLVLPAENASAIGAAVVAGAAARTTKLSAEWLQAAARGEAIPVWRELIAALRSGDHSAILAATTRVAATGHTSGIASLAGFVAAWRAMAHQSGTPTQQLLNPSNPPPPQERPSNEDPR